MALFSGEVAQFHRKGGSILPCKWYSPTGICSRVSGGNRRRQFDPKMISVRFRTFHIVVFPPHRSRFTHRDPPVPPQIRLFCRTAHFRPTKNVHHNGKKHGKPLTGSTKSGRIIIRKTILRGHRLWGCRIVSEEREYTEPSSLREQSLREAFL